MKTSTRAPLVWYSHKVEIMTTSTARGEFTHGFAKPYTVTLWGSNPDETDNDDCWTGVDFATREEAIDTRRTKPRRSTREEGLRCERTDQAGREAALAALPALKARIAALTR